MTERLFMGAMEMRRLPGAAARSAAEITPPGESALRGIIRRFEEAEVHVRGLLAEAVTGDRSRLLAEALEAIGALRDEQVEDAVHEAYETAYEGAAGDIEAMSRSSQGTENLAGSLDEKLTEATYKAEEGSRSAFPTVDEDNLEESSQEAVTGLVDEDERRWPLGAYAAMAAHTLGRRATSRGIKDASAGGEVRISSHGTLVPVCKPLEGKVFPAVSAPEPPFHEGCQHMLEPLG
jgi:hypothetical protein